MRSGKKNALVSIYTLTETVNSRINSAVFAPAIWKADIFCWITMKRSKESDIGNQATFETLAIFDFEYYDVEGIDEEMIIVHEGVEYDIRAILADVTLKEFTTVHGLTRPAPTGRT